MILPKYTLEYNDLSEVPKSMILPAQSGISVTLHCNSEASVKIHCVPEKLDQGSLTCSLAANNIPKISASTKSKRNVKIPKFSVISDTMEDLNQNVAPIWSDLTPEVFSCTTSIAGCDFCFYYLSTYNLSVAPAACVGGCSLGAFGACSKLITSSLIKTLDLSIN